MTEAVTDNDRIIAEEYKLWKKNVPFMYDYISTRAFEYPSPTLQWLPYRSAPIEEDDRKSTVQRLLHGTNTRDSFNYLMVSPVVMPGYLPPVQNDIYHLREDEFGSISYYPDQVEPQIKVAHDGEVTCARYMPHNADIIASKSPMDLFIYDLKSCYEDQEGQDKCEPIHEYLGLNSNSALEWSPRVEGHLLTSFEPEPGQCHHLALWNVACQKRKNMVARQRFHFRPPDEQGVATVADVAFHALHPSIIGAATSTGEFALWDMRSNSTKKASHQVKGHKGALRQLAFNPFSEFVFATSSEDHTIAIWDLRNLGLKIHSIADMPNKEVMTRLAWSPMHTTVLGASNGDRRVYLFDLSLTLEVGTEEELVDGPTTLIFAHGGHSSRVYDFAWNPNEDLVIASTSDDNVIQVWQIMNKYIAKKHVVPVKMSSAAAATTTKTTSSTTNTATSVIIKR